MEDLIVISIGLGLVISLLFSEIFGVAAGGMVVPGYFALYLNKPIAILMTLLISYLTFLIVHSLSSFLIIYGRRRTVLMILVGYLVGMLARWSISSFGVMSGSELQVIGYIIPGLIAIWLDRQGVVETVAAMVTASVVVRLVLLLVVGLELST